MSRGWLKAVIIGAVCFMVGSAVFLSASDRYVSYYPDKGFRISYMLREGIFENTDVAHRLQKQVVEKTFTFTTNDSNWYTMLVVPDSTEIIIQSARISCRIEPNETPTQTDSLPKIQVVAYDSSAATLKNIVTLTTVDAGDIAWDDVPYALTLTNTTWYSGDIIYLTAVKRGSALTTAEEGAGLTIEYLLRENKYEGGVSGQGLPADSTYW